MSIFDMIDDMANRQIQKTETGDNRIFGVVVGTVVKNYSQEMPGRICVSIPIRDSGEEGQKWARLAMPSMGSTWGHYFLPEVGDQVLLIFEQGNIEKPFVIGAVAKDADQFLKKSVSEKNEKKRIVTKHGNAINFFDSGEDGSENGEKDNIEIITAQGTHFVQLDNDKKSIVVSDKDKNCRIEMMTDENKGAITITAAKKLTINVGEEISLIFNGSSGTTELKTKKFKISDAESIMLEAGKKFSATAATASIEGSSQAKISGGPVTIEGSPIKIG